MEFAFEVPGTCLLVDHSLFRTFNKGALGMLKVTGPDDKPVYSRKEVDSVYISDKAVAGGGQVVAGTTLKEKEGALTKEDQIKAGEVLYNGTCSTCNQADGKGLPDIFPPLAGSDYLMADKQRAIGIVLNGLNGPVTVNGKSYTSVMPPLSNLNNDEVANIFTYVRNSWGNSGDEVSSAEVAAVRSSTPRPPGAPH